MLKNRIQQDVGSSLTAGILTSDDPAMVADGLPAYIIMLDGMIVNNPENPELLLAAAKINNLYASQFVNNKDRNNKISEKAFQYAKKAICTIDGVVCGKLDAPFDQFSVAIDQSTDLQAEHLFTFASVWTTRIQANSSDWNAIANLAKVEFLIDKVLERQPDFENGTPHIYLGVLSSLIPPALGGTPDVAKQHFEDAINISQGHNLMAKTLYAKHYARLMFDRELHDRLLHEVVDAQIETNELALSNTLAKSQARELLATEEEYF